jgi:hypothetical protein
MRLIDMTGKCCGFLTVEARAGWYRHPTGNWSVTRSKPLHCGAEKIVNGTHLHTELQSRAVALVE